MAGRINIFSFSVYRVLELTFVDDAGAAKKEKEAGDGQTPSTGTPINDPGTGGQTTPSDGGNNEADPTDGKKGMKPDDEVLFFYKEKNHDLKLPWNWKDVGTLTQMNAPVPTWVQTKALFKNSETEQGYFYLMLMPIDAAGKAITDDGKEVVAAYTGSTLGYSEVPIECGCRTWSSGAPSFSSDDKTYYNKFTGIPYYEGLVSNGFKIKMIADTKKRTVRVEWASPTIFIYETSRLFSINVAALYDPGTRMTHLFTTHAGNCGGEYSGSGGITIQEQIIDDDTWEKKNVPIPRSVLDSYLMGGAPLRSEGGYCLGPLPGSQDISLDKSDVTTQQKGGTGPQYYDAVVSYDFLVNKIIIKNTVSGKDLDEAFKSWAGGAAQKEPGSFRLCNFTSSFEASSGYSQGFGGDSTATQPAGSVVDNSNIPDPPPPTVPGAPDKPSETPPTETPAPALGGGLPYDGAYFEQLMTPPKQFASTGTRFVPFIATNSLVTIYPPTAPLKKIVAPGEPVAFQGVERDSLFRAEFPRAASEKPIIIPKGTSVKKRQYVSGLSVEQQDQYQDQCEGDYLYPYYASSPTAVCDNKGNHYLAMETSTGNSLSAGRVDFAYSRGLQGQFSIIRDITTRQVIPPTKEELDADDERRKEYPESYAEIDDPDPAPEPALLPRLLVDNGTPFVYVFFVYKQYIWCKIIPIEFFQQIEKSSGQLSLEDEAAISHRFRQYYTVKVTSFYYYTDAYSSSPGDYSVFQDRHGTIYIALENNYPLEPSLENYRSYPYQELISTLKIVKSTNGGMNWTSVLPADFNWFPKRRRTRMCISGYSPECDDLYVHGGPRNMECLYDPSTHVLNLFFMMYGCIMFSRIPMEVFQMSDQAKLSEAMKRLEPYVIYGSISPSIDVQGVILSEEDACTDAKARGIGCSKDVTRRGRTDSGIMIPHRRGAIRTTHGNYRLFFLDERYRYKSLMSFDCGSSWYTESEVLQKRVT